MYALCASGAVNMQGFVWKCFTRYIYIFIHSFIQKDICMSLVLRSVISTTTHNTHTVFNNTGKMKKSCHSSWPCEQTNKETIRSNNKTRADCQCCEKRSKYTNG